MNTNQPASHTRRNGNPVVPRLELLASKAGLILTAAALLLLGVSLMERANPWVMEHVFPGPDTPKIYLEPVARAISLRKLPLDFDPQNNQIVFGRNDLTVELRDLETGELIHRFGPLIQPGTPGYRRGILDLVTFSNPGTLIFIFEGRVWEAERSGTRKLSSKDILSLPRGRSNYLFSPDRRFFAVGSEFRYGVLDEDWTPVLQSDAPGMRAGPMFFSWSNDSRHLLGYNREGLVVIDTQLPAVVHELDELPEGAPHTQRVLSASITPDGKSWIQAVPDEWDINPVDPKFVFPHDTLSRHDMATGEYLWRTQAPHGVTRVYMTAQSRSVFLETQGMYGTSLVRIDMSTGEEIPMPYTPGKRLHSIPNQNPSQAGRFIVNQFDHVWLVDMERHRPPIFLLRDERTTHAKWLDDDRLFLLSTDSTARVMRRRHSENFGLWVLPQTWFIHVVCLLAGLGLFEKLRRNACPPLHPGFTTAMGLIFLRTFWNGGRHLIVLFSRTAFYNRTSEVPLAAVLPLILLIFGLYLLVLVRVMQGGKIWRRILIGLETLALLSGMLIFAWIFYGMTFFSTSFHVLPLLNSHAWIVELPEPLFHLKHLLILLLRATVLVLLIRFAPPPGNDMKEHCNIKLQQVIC